MHLYKRNGEDKLGNGNLVVQYSDIIIIPEFSKGTYNKKTDVGSLYHAVKSFHEMNPVKAEVQPPGLRPRLRQYQKQGLRWMLQREGSQSKEAGCMDLDCGGYIPPVDKLCSIGKDGKLGKIKPNKS